MTGGRIVRSLFRGDVVQNNDKVFATGFNKQGGGRGMYEHVHGDLPMCIGRRLADRHLGQHDDRTTNYDNVTQHSTGQYNMSSHMQHFSSKGGGTGAYASTDGDVPISMSRQAGTQHDSTKQQPDVTNQVTQQSNTSNNTNLIDDASLRIFLKNRRGLTNDDRLEEL